MGHFSGSCDTHCTGQATGRPWRCGKASQTSGFEDVTQFLGVEGFGDHIEAAEVEDLRPEAVVRMM